MCIRAISKSIRYFKHRPVPLKEQNNNIEYDNIFFPSFYRTKADYSRKAILYHLPQQVKCYSILHLYQVILKNQKLKKKQPTIVTCTTDPHVQKSSVSFSLCNFCFCQLSAKEKQQDKITNCFQITYCFLSHENPTFV